MDRLSKKKGDIYIDIDIDIYTHTHTYTHRHRQRCGDSQREEAGVSGAGRDFAGGNGYTMQYADGVLLSCILATCMVL